MANNHEPLLWDLPDLSVDLPPLTSPEPEPEPLVAAAPSSADLFTDVAVELADVAVEVSAPFALFGHDLFGDPVQQKGGRLAERFTLPPFSVLDARQGAWQDRKRAWLALGIQSELGRGNANLGMSHPETTSTIDFYAQKRALEAELGRALTKDEAAAEMATRGTLTDDRAANREWLREERQRTPGERDANSAWFGS